MGKITDRDKIAPLELTVGEALAVREAIDFVAANSLVGKWGRWREAAGADTKIFNALPDPVQDYELTRAEGKGSK